MRNEQQWMCDFAVLRLCVCVFSWWGGEGSKYFPDRTEVLRSPVISPWNMCVRGSLHIVHVMAVECLRKHDMWLQHSWESCSCLTSNVDKKMFPYWWVNLWKEKKRRRCLEVSAGCKTYSHGNDLLEFYILKMVFFFSFETWPVYSIWMWSECFLGLALQPSRIRYVELMLARRVCFKRFSNN